MFRAMAKHMPPPPADFKPPVLWGTEERIREIFSGASEIRCEKRRAPNGARAESADAWLDYMERVLGPMVLAKQALGDRWPDVRAELHDLYTQHNDADDGTFWARPEYLLSVIS